MSKKSTPGSPNIIRQSWLQNNQWLELRALGVAIVHIATTRVVSAIVHATTRAADLMQFILIQEHDVILRLHFLRLHLFFQESFQCLIFHHLKL
jgi:hypothetical protein